MASAMRAWIASCCVILGLLQTGCASTRVARAPDTSLFHDELFAPRTEDIDAAAVLAPSPQMLAFIASEVVPRQRQKGSRQALFDALYVGTRPWLDYDATISRNAAQAFEARSGNCLSLVLMTAAMARQLDLEVRFQFVYTQESWSRDEVLSYLNRHVSLLLLQPPGDDAVLVDFEPAATGDKRRFRIVQTPTIIAMYMNNRAVELLAQGEFDRAYWWARAAIAQDPGFVDPVNTLAVVYRARGHYPEAERTLRKLLEGEPDNIVALENLVPVLRDQGRDAEAQALAKRLQELRPLAPFQSYDLGMEALRQGQYERARGLFQKELRRDARYDKFHASLALAYYGLGEMDKAREQMAIAVDNSSTAADRAMYSRMLDKLKAGQHP
jgi:Tfp pilus assembly protein PilF